MALTNKQDKFVTEYLKDYNATQAALRAGYSPKTAYSIGAENTKKPEIIEALRQKTMGSAEVLANLTDIAKGNITDLMDVTPSGFTLNLMSKDAEDNLSIKPQSKLIKKIKQKVTTILAKKESDEDREIIETEIELYSAYDALVTLGKYHKLFVDKSEVDITTQGEKVNSLDGYDRAISTLANAIRKVVPGEGAESNSAVDSAK